VDACRGALEALLDRLRPLGWRRELGWGREAQADSAALGGGGGGGGGCSGGSDSGAAFSVGWGLGGGGGGGWFSSACWAWRACGSSGAAEAGEATSCWAPERDLLEAEGATATAFVRCSRGPGAVTAEGGGGTGGRGCALGFSCSASLEGRAIGDGGAGPEGKSNGGCENLQV
jgi:hypothetical protein